MFFSPMWDSWCLRRSLDVMKVFSRRSHICLLPGVTHYGSLQLTGLRKKSCHTAHSHMPSCRYESVCVSSRDQSKKRTFDIERRHMVSLQYGTADVAGVDDTF